MTILGVIREDVGTGKDYKQASTDAFKRAAVRFGIGHELYAYGKPLGRRGRTTLLRPSRRAVLPMPEAGIEPA